ncbi:hypothetical protein LLS1_29470 [Leifsonia sp. LS1]|uniref:GntR family transcriptional regulator n=1 Tax=unclassified Leifsonia TaxID=2663824 RepID=UPI001CBF6394|nr:MULTISPECIES: GntR family transcriptional regulator [unclassified Leifsonia]UAJ79829.1 GntR family transcriptional regulator [Leifsonia sp. ZF2019]GIT81278.1 hypothetical protein LLS1_29470 [Leifsonia sp. LS1]
MPAKAQTNDDGSRPGGQKRVLRYQYVYDLVIDLIQDQNLQPGDQLPSTAELAELAGVSVISVRRALDELTHRGKIVRHQGVGTFVAPRRIVSEPSRPGALLQTLRGPSGDDVHLETELVSMLVGIPSDQHATALGIEPGAPVWEVARLRRLGSTPKVLETAVLPLSLVPSLDEAHLAAGGSLYELLADRYGYTDEFVEQAIEVDEPTSWERGHLGLSAKDNVVRIRGVSLGADGVAFDSFRQTYPAHDFVFYVSGTSRQRLVEPHRDGSWAVRPLGAPATAGAD